MKSSLLLLMILVPISICVTVLNNSVRSQETPRKAGNHIRQLLIERRDVARECANGVETEVRFGAKPLDQFLRAQNVLLDAEVELAQTHDEKCAIFERRVTSLQRMEAEAKAKHDIGIGSLVDHLSAKAERLKAEIDLLRAQDGA